MTERSHKIGSILCITVLVISIFTLVGHAEVEPEDQTRDIVLITEDIESSRMKIDDIDMEIIDEYGEFTLVDIDVEDIEKLREKEIRFEELHGRTEISVKGHTFDIFEEEPDLDEELMIDEYQSGEEGLYLVHMLGPINPEWVQELKNKDVDIINYIPNYAYEVKMTPEQAEDVEELFFVDWVDIYHPGFKLSEGLETGSVEISLVRDAERKTINRIDSITESIGSADLLERNSKLTAEVDNEEDLVELAHLEDVYHISNRVEKTLDDEVATQIISGGSWIWDPDEDPYSPWRGEDDEFDYGSHVNQLGWSGEDEVIAVADTGINPDHLDFQERVVGGHYWDSEDWEDGHGHGTHVAGSIAGDTHNGTGTTVDTLEIDGIEIEELGPYYAAQGPAYGSELFSVKIFDSSGEWVGPNDYFEIVESAAQNSDSYIHSNSWGSDENLGEYLASSEAYDEAVRDSNRMSLDNEPMVIVVAAGNEGSSQNSVGAPATAKNVIAVGSTENFMPDLSTENPDRVSLFSSRGWTDDNRVKPDVVAPGQNIISTDYEADGDYTRMSGTSMAAPAASGAASLVVEWYEEKYGDEPSPAMVRNLLINTAHDLDDDNGNTGPIPNRDEGWGMVNLPALMDSSAEFEFEDQNSLLETGDINEYEFEYEDEYEPIKVTLTWTDKEASEDETSTLKNNLDLEIETPSGEIIRGNAFDLSGDGVSDDGYTYPDADVLEDFDTNGDGRDDVNNVQNVYIHPDDLETGSYTVRVIGTDINSDSNNDGLPNQDYALTMYNSLEEPEGENPSIEITSPSEGDVWEARTDEEISWDSEGGDDPTDTVSLYYSNDDGRSWEIIDEDVDDDEIYNWEIPNVDSRESRVRVEVTDEVGRTDYDISDQFTIEGIPPEPPENLEVDHASVREGWHHVYEADHREPVDRAVGVDQKETWYGAVRTEIPEGEIKNIAYYHADDADSVRASIHQDEGGEPGEKLAETHDLRNFDNERWHEIPLKNALESTSNHYWIVLEIDDPGSEYFPIGIYDEEVEYGGYIKHSGTSGWESRDYSWAVEALVRETDEDDNLLTWDSSSDDPDEVSHYNIYRADEDDGSGDDLIGQITADGSDRYEYIDENKGMEDTIFWWYVVRSVGENGLEDENEDAVQEPLRPFQVEITYHEEQIIKEEEGIFDYQVTNIGDHEETQSIDFKVRGDIEDTSEITLDAGEQYTGIFTWKPPERGAYRVEITTDDHSDYSSVSVVEDSYFDIRIRDMQREIVEGDELTVEYDVENTGEAEETQTLSFEISDDEEIVYQDDKDVEISEGERKQDKFTWQTIESDAGNYEVSISSDDDEDDYSLEVWESDRFIVDFRIVDRDVVEGDHLTVEFTIINTKETESKQDVDFSVYDLQLSDDAELIHNDVIEDLTLRPGEKHEDEFVWETEEGDAGRYDIVISTEDYEEDSFIRIIPKDIFYIDIDLFQREFQDDEDIIINYTVTNTKDFEESQDIIFSIYDDGKIHEDIHENVSLEPGETEERQFIWDEDDIVNGNFEIKVESRDYNETHRITVWRANSFSVITQLSPRHQNGEVIEGRVVTVLYQVKNTKEEMDTQDIRFYVDDQLITIEEDLELQPGELIEDKDLEWTAELPSGERTLMVESADVSEELTIEVLEKARFEVEINSPEDEQFFEEDEQIVVNYTVKNTGDVKDSQNINLLVDGRVVEDQVIEIEAGGSVTDEYEWEAIDEYGEIEIKVRTRDHEESISITIEGEDDGIQDIPGFTISGLIIGLLATIILYIFKKKSKDE